MCHGVTLRGAARRRRNRRSHMVDESRVSDLVEQALTDGLTPEEACAQDPELLADVRAMLNNCRNLETILEEVFPSDTPSESFPGPQLPTIPGYQVLSVLGRGGTGIIYRVRHLKLNRVIALKMLLSGE